MIILLILNLAFLGWLIHQLTHMETRLMAQIDDLRTEEGNVKQAIIDAGNRVVAKLDTLEAKINDLPTSAPQAEDLTADIQSLRDDVTALSRIGADNAPNGADNAADGTATITPGDTIGISTDPNAPPVDHLVTGVSAGGTVTAEPLEDAKPEDDAATTGDATAKDAGAD